MSDLGTKRPTHYVRLPKGTQCRCMSMWVDPDGSKWCCKGASYPGVGGATLHVVDGTGGGNVGHNGYSHPDPIPDGAKSNEARVAEAITQLTTDFGRAPSASEAMLIEHLARVHVHAGHVAASRDVDDVAIASETFLAAHEAYEEAKAPSVHSMKLRDHFAGHVLRVIAPAAIDAGASSEFVAMSAYELASAMIAAREAQP